MPVSAPVPQIYSPEPRITRFWTNVSAAVIALSVGSIWLYSTQSLTDKVFYSVVLICLLALSLAHRYRYQVVLDNEGLTERSLLGSTRLKWCDIDDLVIVENITLIKSSRRGKSISIFHPDKGNLFHSIGALKNHTTLREEILSRSIPYLREIWSHDKKERIYNFPLPSAWLLLLAASPISIPFLAIIVFGGRYLAEDGWNYILLFSPFVVVCIYVAYRCGLFSRKKTLVLNDKGAIAKNRGEIIVLWDQVSRVVDDRTTLGLGNITIQSYANHQIVIPKSIERFSDLALQLKKRLPDSKFQVSLGTGV